MTAETETTLPSSPFSEHDTLNAEEAEVLAADPGLDEMVHHSDMIYIKVGLVLAVLTAIEIALPAILDDGKIYGPLLVGLMVIKFLLVAMFFMHLRFENRLLSIVFYGGAVLAIVIYLVTLSVFVFWSDSGNPEFNDPPPPQTAVPAETLNPEGG
ncbi:MAG: cytochrome C oxidase subunit IV family protein [Microthrixaceae bacterium]